MKITGWTDADNHKYINIDESGFEFDELDMTSAPGHQTTTMM